MDIAFPRIEPAIEQFLFAQGSRRSLPVARIRLGGVPRGAVIVLCDTGALERDAAGIMNGLVEHGYESVAVDLSPTADVDGAGVHVPSERELLDDVAVLLGGWVERGWSAEQVGLVGNGFGGRVALLAAAEFELGAAVSVVPSEVVPLSPRTPWLGLLAGQDQAASPDDVKRLRARLHDAPVYTELVTYPGVAGDFHFQSRETTAHAAAFDAWQRTVEWLDRRVVPRPTPLAREWRRRSESA
ncbi:dienelactone hydrolase family protein [Streptomyces canus]|uniref:dienelactone hydrolase family protein n=1 Tax=Streptomyces canus TaxID=58343 RepID=UPI0032552FF2